MSEMNSKGKKHFWKKGLKIAIVVVCLAALALVVVFPKLIFPEKSGGKTADSKATSPATEAKAADSKVTSPAAEEKAADSKAVTPTLEVKVADSETVSPTPEDIVEDSEPVIADDGEIVYYQSGCGIVRGGVDGYAEEHFFVTDPLIYTWKDPIYEYELSSTGKLAVVRCKEVRYSTNTWLFDTEGRPIELNHADADSKRGYVEEYQYDDQGRISRITTTAGDKVRTTEVIYGEGKKRTARHFDENGRLRSEEEYDGLQQISETFYDEEGNVEVIE